MTEHDSATPAQAKPLATWRAAFLLALTETGKVTAAAAAAEVSRQHCYLCRSNDPSFAEEWDEALVKAADRLVERAWARANFEHIQYKFHPKTGAPLRFPEGHELEGQPYFEHVGSDTVLLRLLEAYQAP